MSKIPHIYLLKQWRQALKVAIYGSRPLWDFMANNLSLKPVSTATTQLKSRRAMVVNNLTKAVSARLSRESEVASDLDFMVARIRTAKEISACLKPKNERS